MDDQGIRVTIDREARRTVSSVVEQTVCSQVGMPGEGLATLDGISDTTLPGD